MEAGQLFPGGLDQSRGGRSERAVEDRSAYGIIGDRRTNTKQVNKQVTISITVESLSPTRWCDVNWQSSRVRVGVDLYIQPRIKMLGWPCTNPETNSTPDMPGGAEQARWKGCKS